MTSKQKVTAKQMLLAVRRKHAQDAVVRELVLDDHIEAAIRRRDHLNRDPRMARHYEGKEIADEVPADWKWRDEAPRRRIDALIMTSSLLTALEIKCTRADFRRETEGKRRAWREVTDRYVYLAPKGIIPLDELPDYCGLWEYDPEMDRGGYSAWSSGLTIAKKAKRNPNRLPFPPQLQLALAYRSSRYEFKEEAAKASGRLA